MGDRSEGCVEMGREMAVKAKKSRARMVWCPYCEMYVFTVKCVDGECCEFCCQVIPS